MDDQQRGPLASRLSAATMLPGSPRDAMKSFWGRAFTYSGRATRAEYNWALAFFLIYDGVVLAAVIGVGLQDTWRGVAMMFALLLVFIVPWFALIARRCHDINRRGAFGLLLLATGLGFVVTEGILMFSGSDPRGARFDAVNASRD